MTACEAISPHAGPKVAAGDSVALRWATRASYNGELLRYARSWQATQPVRPGTYIGPTRAYGGYWLIVMNGIPAAKQAPLTQRSIRCGGKSAASSTKSAPWTTWATSAALPTRREMARTSIDELKAPRARAAAGAFSAPTSASVNRI